MVTSLCDRAPLCIPFHLGQKNNQFGLPPIAGNTKPNTLGGGGIATHLLGPETSENGRKNDGPPFDIARSKKPRGIMAVFIHGNVHAAERKKEKLDEVPEREMEGHTKE